MDPTDPDPAPEHWTLQLILLSGLPNRDQSTIDSDKNLYILKLWCVALFMEIAFENDDSKNIAPIAE